MFDIKELIHLALEEDIGTGDVTTDPLVEEDRTAGAIIVAKEPLILAGLWVAGTVFATLDAELRFEPAFKDGDRLQDGGTIVRLYGRLRALLTGERTALNFLQRLSGIATLTREYVDRVAGSRVRLTDTRKTTPGWRMLEKYAVRTGGAHNHRLGLYDGVLIKDNHIASCGGITRAVTGIRNSAQRPLQIEVEVSDLGQVKEALDNKVDVIMLDNMQIADIRMAMDMVGARVLVEVSGGVTLNNLAELAATGVDIISIGALTHSARAVDISMRVLG